MLNYFRIYLLSSCVVSILLLTQPAMAKLKHVSLGNISVEEGLSQASVYSILQDDTGFMWFGSESGVNYYDGYKVSTLLGPNGEFPSYSVNSIRKTQDGKVWFSFWGGDGIHVYDPKTNSYEFVSAKDPENSDYLAGDIIEQSTNDIWIVTNKSLYLYHPLTHSFGARVDLTEYIDGKNGVIYRAKYYQGHLYIGTGLGIYVYSIKDNKLAKLPDVYQNNDDIEGKIKEQANKVYDFAFNQGRVYFGTNQGVFSFNTKTAEHIVQALPVSIDYQLAVPEAAVWEMVVGQDKLYIGAVDGLHVYDTLSETHEYLFEFSDFDPTVANANVISLELDNNGVLWMGSSASGAFSWSPNTTKVENFTYNKYRADGLLDNSIGYLHVQSTQPEILWVGTGEGLNKVELDTGKVSSYLKNTDPKTTSTDSNIFWIGEDGDSRLWLNTYIGMRLFDLKTQSQIGFQYTDEINQWLSTFNGVVHLQNNKIWAISGEGVYTLAIDTGERVQYDSFPSSFDFNTVMGIMKPLSGDEPNEVLLSTHEALWSFNAETGTFFELYKHPEKTLLTYTYIDSLVEDSAGNIWLAFPGVGLVKLNSQFQFEQIYNLSNSGIEPNVYGVFLDTENNLWFSSHSGMYHLDVETDHLRQFGRYHGFVNTEFNSGAFVKLADGRFAYGGQAGISIFDPITLSNEKSNQKNTDQRVTIVNVSALSRDLKLPLVLDGNQEINLHYDDVGIRVDFSTFSQSKGDKPLYQYQFVKGVSYPESKQNYVLFPNLKSGIHQFEVRSKSSITGQLSQPTRIAFNVSYAPWRSPTAIVIYCLFIATVLIIWQRGRYLRQKELLHAHEQVKYRENRLQLALTGSNSEVWDWKSETNEIFGKRLVRDLGYQEDTLSHSFDEHLDFIHPEDRDDFLSRWQMFLLKADKESSFECSYRLRSASGNWVWYKDLGKIVAFDFDRIPTRVTGSYTNITESRANLERAQYYGAAFEHTKDWVLIIDENFVKVRANRSMAQIFDWRSEELLFSPELLGLNEKRIAFYQRLIPKIKVKGHWRGEEIVKTPKGEKYHVIINISVSKAEHMDQAHFICVLTDITAQKAAEKELRYMANYDHLTGLPNRSLLLDRITHAMEFSARNRQSIALFFIDLDRFKQVNDSLGHEYGDKLLKEITKRLVNVLRADDTVARIGGDEFVVLLESYKSNNELSRIAQKIIRVVEQPVDLNNNVVSVGTSIGISLYPEDSSDSDELLRHADVAMYYAKQQGRNNFQFFTEHMNQEATQRLKKESNLKLAVANDEFFNLYQPIVDAHTGKAVGSELLMRWKSENQIISPLEFIPLAEELGLIVKMTEIAMEKGFTELNKWREQRPEFFLSVNFSAAHFINEDLVSFIEGMLNKHNLPANALKVEVTESALISDPDKAISAMNRLNILGVRLSLDDFGTGYSSLSYLKKLPLDIIKIDRSFVSGIGNEKTDEAIVDATLVLAKSLNMYCVAEGVETLDQLQYLVDRECHFIQGYLYYPPISPQALLEHITENKVEIKAVSQRSN